MMPTPCSLCIKHARLCFCSVTRCGNDFFATVFGQVCCANPLAAPVEVLLVTDDNVLQVHHSLRENPKILTFKLQAQLKILEKCRSFVWASVPK